MLFEGVSECGRMKVRTVNYRKVLLQGGILIFKTITYLESGNDVQRRAFKVMNELNILDDMSEYTPILCGMSIHDTGETMDSF